MGKVRDNVPPVISLGPTDGRKDRPTNGPTDLRTDKEVKLFQPGWPWYFDKGGDNDQRAERAECRKNGGHHTVKHWRNERAYRCFRDKLGAS